MESADVPAQGLEEPLGFADLTDCSLSCVAVSRGHAGDNTTQVCMPEWILGQRVEIMVPTVLRDRSCVSQSASVGCGCGGRGGSGDGGGGSTLPLTAALILKRIQPCSERQCRDTSANISVGWGLSQLRPRGFSSKGSATPAAPCQ